MSLDCSSDPWCLYQGDRVPLLLLLHYHYDRLCSRYSKLRRYTEYEMDMQIQIRMLETCLRDMDTCIGDTCEPLPFDRHLTGCQYIHEYFHALKRYDTNTYHFLSILDRKHFGTIRRVLGPYGDELECVQQSQYIGYVERLSCMRTIIKQLQHNQGVRQMIHEISGRGHKKPKGSSFLRTLLVILGAVAVTYQALPTQPLEPPPSFHPAQITQEISTRTPVVLPPPREALGVEVKTHRFDNHLDHMLKAERAEPPKPIKTSVSEFWHRGAYGSLDHKALPRYSVETTQYFSEPPRPYCCLKKFTAAMNLVAHSTPDTGVNAVSSTIWSDANTKKRTYITKGIDNPAAQVRSLASSRVFKAMQLSQFGLRTPQVILIGTRKIATKFINHADPLLDHWFKLTEKLKHQIGVMTLFDMMVGNADRHLNNVMVDEQGNLVLIDHDRTFSTTQLFTWRGMVNCLPR